jgi:amidase
MVANIGQKALEYLTESFGFPFSRPTYRKNESNAAMATNGQFPHDDVLRTAASLGYTISEQDVAEFAALLDKARKAYETVAAMDDYQPQPDLNATPRRNIYFPEKPDNPLNAWAWKFTCSNSNPSSKLLEGKTVCLKDNIAMAGVPCLVGTDSFTGWTPVTDATVVTRILEHGGTITGKAVCENLSRGAVSVTAATGPVHNPYAKGYSAGGSSSGTAALVGSGAVDMGIGCDQGGSIRIPAGLCGLWGFKATLGLVPYTGIASNDASVDFVGPITKTGMDCAVLLEVLAGVDGMDDRQIAGTPFPGEVPKYAEHLERTAKDGVKGLKIGILKEGIAHSVIDPGVKQKFEAACQKWRDLGAEVGEVSVPIHDQARTIYTVCSKMGNHMGMLGRSTGRRQVMLTDLFEKKHLPYTQEALSKMSVFAREGLLAGEYGWQNYPLAYPKAVNIGRKIKEAYDAALEKFDLLVMPTTITPADPLPPVDASPLEHMAKGIGKLENTSAFNASGHPALAFPIGLVPAKDDENIKVPASMQIVGKYWDEAKILQAAYAWEQSVDWKTF